MYLHGDLHDQTSLTQVGLLNIYNTVHITLDYFVKSHWVTHSHRHFKLNFPTEK